MGRYDEGDRWNIVDYTLGDKLGNVSQKKNKKNNISRALNCPKVKHYPDKLGIYRSIMMSLALSMFYQNK